DHPPASRPPPPATKSSPPKKFSAEFSGQNQKGSPPSDLTDPPHHAPPLPPAPPPLPSPSTTPRLSPQPPLHSTAVIPIHHSTTPPTPPLPRHCHHPTATTIAAHHPRQPSPSTDRVRLVRSQQKGCVWC
nr:hypothetical protein [Tanacetum cinerariifolium]